MLHLLQQLAEWLYSRTHAVYNDLERHQSNDGQPLPESIEQPDWTLVCAATAGSCSDVADVVCFWLARPVSVTAVLKCVIVPAIPAFEPMAVTSETWFPTPKTFAKTLCAQNTTPCTGVAVTRVDYSDSGAHMACVMGFTSSRKAKGETMCSLPSTPDSRSPRKLWSTTLRARSVRTACSAKLSTGGTPCSSSTAFMHQGTKLARLHACSVLMQIITSGSLRSTRVSQRWATPSCATFANPSGT